MAGTENSYLGEGLVLFKTVAQATPSFVMSVFLIPISLCLEIEMMLNSF